MPRKIDRGPDARQRDVEHPFVRRGHRREVLEVAAHDGHRDVGQRTRGRARVELDDEVVVRLIEPAIDQSAGDTLAPITAAFLVQTAADCDERRGDDGRRLAQAALAFVETIDERLLTRLVTALTGLRFSSPSAVRASR